MKPFQVTDIAQVLDIMYTDFRLFYVAVICFIAFSQEIKATNIYVFLKISK